MRLIDADKLMTVLGQRMNHNNIEITIANTINNLIKDQPTVNEWIPVSERLPEYDEIVLLKIKDGEDYWYDNVVIGKRRKANKFTQQREEYITTGMIVHDFDDVIAWKPIEPYKENE